MTHYYLIQHNTHTTYCSCSCNMLCLSSLNLSRLPFFAMLLFNENLSTRWVSINGLKYSTFIFPATKVLENTSCFSLPFRGLVQWLFELKKYGNLTNLFKMSLHLVRIAAFVLSGLELSWVVGSERWENNNGQLLECRWEMNSVTSERHNFAATSELRQWQN